MALDAVALAALPIGTTNAQAFASNAETIDRVVNGTAATVATRTGKNVLSLDEAMRKIGFETPVAFASGLSITRATQTVVSGGLTYHANPASVPFTTTSTFNAGQWMLVSNVTAQDLASTAPNKGADLVFGTVRSVASVAALRLLSKFGRPHAITLGYWAAGDNGGGAYRLDAADTTSADNGVSVIVAADGGRWKLLVAPGFVNVRQAGARGNGANDDTAAIQAAINSITTGVVYFPAGRYYVAGVLSVNKGGVTLRGESVAGQAAVTGNAVTEILCGSAVGIRFGDPTESSGYGSHIYPGGAIENMAVTGSASTTSGIRIYNITVGISGCFVSNVMGSGGTGIWMKSAWCSTIERTFVQGNASRDIYLGDATNSIKLDSVTCLSNTSSVGVYIVGGTNTISLINCDFEGKSHGVYCDTGSASIENLSLIGTNTEGCVNGGFTVAGAQPVNGLQIRGYRGGGAGSGINLNYHKGLNIDSLMLSDCNLNFGQAGQDGSIGSVVLIGTAAISGNYTSIRRQRRVEALYTEYAGAGTVNPGFDAGLYNTVQIALTGAATGAAIAASGGSARGVGDTISILLINAGSATAGGSVSMPSGWKTAGAVVIPAIYKGVRLQFERDPNGQWWETSRATAIG